MVARLACVALILLSACAAPPRERKTLFDPAAYAGLPTTGTASVTGQAFRRTQGGDVRYAAGLEIHLRPKTAYMQEWFERSVIGGEALVQSAQAAIDADRKTIGDGEGRFSFTDVPAGTYYVVSAITWMVPDGVSLSATGGWVGKEITVAEGEHVNVVVTR